jgi:hypothetical protein
LTTAFRDDVSAAADAGDDEEAYRGRRLPQTRHDRNSRK